MLKYEIEIVIFHQCTSHRSSPKHHGMIDEDSANNTSRNSHIRYSLISEKGAASCFLGFYIEQSAAGPSAW